MTKKRGLAYFALITSALIWGIAPPVIKYTLRFISPVSFLFYRFAVASLIVAIPIILRIKKIKPTKKEWLLYLFLGFLCTPLNLILLFLGIEKTTAIDASLISIISPILVVIGGALFLKEEITKTERIGVFITVIGAFFTVLQPLFEANSHVGLNIEGNLLVLAGTLVWVAFTLLIKKFRHLDPFILSSFSFLVGLVFLSPLLFTSHLISSSY
ncbi:MAG: DMT family transporter, partial [Microgenomates group bacterium]